MQEYLRKTIGSKAKGLYICQLPTGYGKSYTVSEIIAEIAKDKNEKRKIIYLTTLKKNLPEDDISSFIEDKELYNKTVLRIHSNLDEVKEKINNILIPEEFKTEEYDVILNAVNNLIKAEKTKFSDKLYIEDLTKRASEAERNFRHALFGRLSKEFNSKSERLKAIHTDKKYKWIGELYPAVFTDERKILLMTISKFLGKNSTIIEPSYDFISSPMIENAIIFIDEFDASKSWVRDHFIEKALGTESEYISLFRQIHRNLDPSSFSKELKDSIKTTEKSRPKWFDNLLNKGNGIIEKYHLNLSYKTEENSVDRKRNFLFNDGSFHTILDNDKHYIRAHKDDDNNRVNILLETKESFYKNRTSSDIQVYGLLRDIHSYFSYFSSCLYMWGEAYRGIINSRRGSTRDNMPIERAVDTILSKLGLLQSQKDLILSEKCRIKRQFKNSSDHNEINYYSKGMEIFELEDSDEHNESTDMQLIKLADTPEKLLRFICERSTVFAISATAEMKTVIGNYNLSYIRSKLGPLYHPMDKELFTRVKAETDNINTPYKNGSIKIRSHVFKESDGAFDAREYCRKLFDKAETADIASNLIDMTASKDYDKERYCRILNAMCHFWMNRSIKSFLYLGMALPKNNNPSMDTDLLKKLLELAADNADEDYNEDVLCVLSGDSFDEKKDKLLDELSKGKKRFVMSSYSTIGAGQNLQYKVNDKSGLVELTPYLDDGDKRHFSKDFDALYLGEITNTLVNTYSQDKISKKDMLTMLTNIEELYNIGEINFKEKDNMIKLAFRAHAGKTKFESNLLYKCRDVRIKATKDVIQAVGRINRTFLKNPEIYLFIDEKLLNLLDVPEIEKNILSPEIEELVRLRKSMGKDYTESENITLNIAERISTEGMWRIRRILSRGWTEESIRLWKELRELVLKFPTAEKSDAEANDLIRELYITSGAPMSRYFYSQYSDFSDVTIDFGDDENAFRNSDRAKIKGEGNETAVWKMSEEESGLPVILKYNGMREMFEQNGYAVAFTDKLYMMSPVLFHNIYKGALGEAAGRFILEKERGIKLRDIDDAERFEFFDFEMADGVYVDFKNWKFTYEQDEESICREIAGKLEHIGGKRVYIINVIGNAENIPSETTDSRIVRIPALIDENGKIISGALDKIKKEDYE